MLLTPTTRCLVLRVVRARILLRHDGKLDWAGGMDICRSSPPHFTFPAAVMTFSPRDAEPASNRLLRCAHAGWCLRSAQPPRPPSQVHASSFPAVAVPHQCNPPLPRAALTRLVAMPFINAPHPNRTPRLAHLMASPFPPPNFPGYSPAQIPERSRRGKQSSGRDTGVARLILPAACLALVVTAFIWASPHSRRALRNHTGQGTSPIPALSPAFCHPSPFTFDPHVIMLACSSIPRHPFLRIASSPTVFIPLLADPLAISATRSGAADASVVGMGVGEPIEIRYENREIMELPAAGTDAAIAAFQSELEESSAMAAREEQGAASGNGESEGGGNSFLEAVEAMKGEGEGAEGGAGRSEGERGVEQGAEGVKAVLAEAVGEAESGASSGAAAGAGESSASEQQDGSAGRVDVTLPPGASSSASPSAPSSPSSPSSSPARADLVERLRNLTAVLEGIHPLAEERGNAQLVKHIRAAVEKSGAVTARWEESGAWGGDDKVTGLVKLLEAVAARAKEWRGNAATIEKLRGEVERGKAKVAALTAERNQLDLAAAKALPKSLHCFNLRLTVEYGSNKDLRAASRRRERKQRALLTDPALMHYALFSDNVLAVATVLRSLEANSKNPDRHVVHVVTDSMNLPAMQAWFALHPPVHVAVEITSVESLAFLNASYCPVLRQLQAKALKKFYFSQHDDSANQTTSGVPRPQGSARTEAEAAGAAAAAAVAGQKLKFKNPKYLSILNHLRFYLPEMFPLLDRVVFLDDDVVVQRDLSPLFTLPLHGAVNGAVYTCREGDAFHRLHKYLNFSHPFIRDHFDPEGCGWAYGMNVFDLAQWRRKGLTDVYHKYQSMVRPFLPASPCLPLSFLPPRASLPATLFPASSCLPACHSLSCLLVPLCLPLSFLPPRAFLPATLFPASSCLSACHSLCVSSCLSACHSLSCLLVPLCFPLCVPLCVPLYVLPLCALPVGLAHLFISPPPRPSPPMLCVPQNSERQLWQLGTLPPGLMTFYNFTAPLDPHWHVLGLGYDKATPTHLIQQAAVLHYNGNAVPPPLSASPHLSLCPGLHAHPCAYLCRHPQCISNPP
ncbi:unnamed protein product [Closterium sp. NIES-54]